MSTSTNARDLTAGYISDIHSYLTRINEEESESIGRAAQLMADQVERDQLIHIYGPGGHANMVSQEAFFRAGGLMHISAILDEGTILSNGALRSIAMERTPGYGSVVINYHNLGEDDVLILANSYGINSAVIDAALTARERGVTLIGISSRSHAEESPDDHPARHPSKANLHDLVDTHIDSKVPVGDALVTVPDAPEPLGALSTFVNSFIVHALTVHTVNELVDRGVEPEVWRSANAPGGDEANARFINRFRQRVPSL